MEVVGARRRRRETAETPGSAVRDGASTRGGARVHVEDLVRARVSFESSTAFPREGRKGESTE